MPERTTTSGTPGGTPPPLAWDGGRAKHPDRTVCTATTTLGGCCCAKWGARDDGVACRGGGGGGGGGGGWTRGRHQQQTRRLIALPCLRCTRVHHRLLPCIPLLPTPATSTRRGVAHTTVVGRVCRYHALGSGAHAPQSTRTRARTTIQDTVSGYCNNRNTAVTQSRLRRGSQRQAKGRTLTVTESTQSTVTPPAVSSPTMRAEVTWLPVCSARGESHSTRSGGRRVAPAWASCQSTNHGKATSRKHYWTQLPGAGPCRQPRLTKLQATTGPLGCKPCAPPKQGATGEAEGNGQAPRARAARAQP